MLVGKEQGFKPVDCVLSLTAVDRPMSDSFVFALSRNFPSYSFAFSRIKSERLYCRSSPFMLNVGYSSDSFKCNYISNPLVLISCRCLGKCLGVKL